ncbi:ABC transporter substrate-binding protein [Nocardia sp. 004]|uniref:ABC transporter substrate-binding protein n=1 Tax=Nocardia sp. 004 TaxID=3385978 RepID=UPI00399FADDE
MRQPRTVLRLIGVFVAGMLTAGSVVGCSGKSQVPSIGYATDATIATYNGGSTLGAVSGSTAVFSRVLTGFFYTGPEGQQIADTDLGTAKEVPGESQTIQYRLNPEGVYSDGVPTSCDDLVLAWAARSGQFTEPGDRGPVPLFDAASTAGYEDIERVDCQPGSRDATVVFRPGRDYLAWRTLFVAGELLPAHIAAAAANVPDVVSAVQAGDLDAIRRLAEFWNTGWSIPADGSLDVSRFPSSGPYRIESFSKEDGLVLVANNRWWGNKPETGRIVVWPKTADMRQKVGENAVNVVDIGMNSVKDLDLKDFSVYSQPGRGVEQLVLSTSGVFASIEARRAFALCLPRQALFDALGKVPDTPKTGIGSGPLNAHIVQQDALLYPAVIGAANKYSGDPANATRAVAASGVPNPTVRIGYLAPDDRRARTVAMIADVCQSVGISVVDAGSPDFTPDQLTTGAVDAILGSTASAHGPAGSVDAVVAISALRAGSGLNVGRFDNGRYDAITDQLAVDDDSTTQLTLLTEAENLLWTQLPSIPLFATPRTIAFGAGLRNGLPAPSRTGTGWNMDRWVLER